MIDFATQLVENIGIFGAGIFIAIESIVVPLPSEFVLLLSGFNVSIGEFQFIPLLIATTAGSLIGALVLYTIGFGISKEKKIFLAWIASGVDRSLSATAVLPIPGRPA